MSKVTDYIDEMAKDPQEPGPFWTEDQTKAWANEYWEIRHAKHPPDIESKLLQEHYGRYRQKINWFQNDRGNLVIRRHLSADRYMFDFDGDFRNDGWEQFDTNQDASYFGVWVNRKLLRTLSYVEGDVTLVLCPDNVCYNAEITDACKFYAEGFEFITCGGVDGLQHLMLGSHPQAEKDITVYRQDRQRFFV